MATFKGVVRPYRKEDGTYRVYIRVTLNRSHRDLATPFYVTQDQITRGFKIKDQSINDKLEDKIREYRAKSNKIGFLADGISIDHFIELLNNTDSNIDFFDFFEEQIDLYRKNKRHKTAHIYEFVLNRLRRYNSNKPLYLSGITKEFVAGFYNSLEGLSNNSKILYISKFKAIYHKAQHKYNYEDDGIIIVRHGVFDNITLPQRTSSKENFLSVEDMQKLIDEPYMKQWAYIFAKDMFILSFVCFGTNMADWLQMKTCQYKDGIISYRRKKTGRQSGDNVDIQIKVPEVGRIILDKYSGDSNWLINFGGRSRNDRFTKYIHYFFAKIGLEDMPENMNNIGQKRTGYTFYASRHTMASIARNICKVEYMTVHNMLNHAAPSSFKTTDTYLYKDYSDIWEANEKLMALFDWSFYLNQQKEDNQIQEEV